MLLYSDSEESVYTATSNNTSRPQTQGSLDDPFGHEEDDDEMHMHAQGRPGRPKLRKDGRVMPMENSVDDDEDDFHSIDDASPRTGFGPPIVNDDIFEVEALTMNELREFQIAERRRNLGKYKRTTSTAASKADEASANLLAEEDSRGSSSGISLLGGNGGSGRPSPQKPPLSRAGKAAAPSTGLLKRIGADEDDSSGKGSTGAGIREAKLSSGAAKVFEKPRNTKGGASPDWFAAAAAPPAPDAKRLPMRDPSPSSGAKPKMKLSVATAKLKKAATTIGSIATATRARSESSSSDDDVPAAFQRAPRDSDEPKSATDYFLKLSKSYEGKQKILDHKNKEFVNKTATADILAKVRQGHMSIPEFMQHYSKIEGSERSGMVHRLVTTSLTMHAEVTKQGKLVELVTFLQKGVKSLVDLEDNIANFARQELGATGAKLYLAKDVPYERIERLGNLAIQCSFAPTAPRVSIIQTVAAARMPATINNAWSHHHYNDRWDGPKAFSIMAMPIWKNAEPREGEMVGVLHIYRTAIATDRTTHVGFERADESTARLLSLPVGPIVEQLRYVNGMAAQATKVTDNTDRVKMVGLRCLNTILAEPKSRTSCEEEMSSLLHSAEELAAISVQASAATLYFLDPKDKSLFSCRPIKTTGGNVKEHFHMIHSMAGKGCSSGKPVRVDLDILVPSKRDIIMGRQDRQRERLTDTPLHNIMAIPIFASSQFSSLITEYAMTLKPKRELIVDDIDALRLPIATSKGKDLGRSLARNPKMADSMLNKWAKIGAEEAFAGEMHMVGVMQVINGIVNLDLGEEGGIRYFMDEDEEVLKEIVTYLGFLMTIVLRRHSRQLSTNESYHIAQKVEEISFALPDIHSSVDVEICLFNCMRKAREIMNADFVRMYIFPERSDDSIGDEQIEDQILSFYQLLGKPKDWDEPQLPTVLHYRQVPSLVRNTMKQLAISRLETSEIQAGGLFVAGLDIVDDGKDPRVTHRCLAVPLPRPSPKSKRPGTNQRMKPMTAMAALSGISSRARNLRPPALTHVGSPLNAMVGAMAVGTYSAKPGDTQLELAHEDVLVELSRVIGMAVRNALKHREKIRIEEERKREKEELLRMKRESHLFQEAERERMRSPDIDRVIENEKQEEGTSSGDNSPPLSR